MTYEFPLLTAKDVECRVQQVTKSGYAILLIYKDARVDMKMLDKVVGATNWQRKHEIVNGNLFCTVSIWDADKSQWISKQDVGTESQTEAEKGQASDSFKRACFNWGIGRELYNSPFICVKLDEKEIEQGRSGKNTTRTKFSVQSMTYDKDKEVFTEMVIVDNKGRERYRLGQKVEAPKPEAKQQPKQAPNQAPNQGNYSQLTCSHCGLEIDQAVADYSIKNYGAELCRVCQAKKKAGMI